MRIAATSAASKEQEQADSKLNLSVFSHSEFPPSESGGNENKSSDGILYQSRSMHDLVSRATAFARSSAIVLITGENGTGKELFARLIHQASQRACKRFGQVNCAALSENLTESELFGHEKGAFTGADRARQGRFEWAEGGSLLLDEISEIPVSTQAKLLRVLEENEFQRIGCNETTRSDVRVIATSNRELSEQVEHGLFRQDLYYRLNVLRIHIPALRERREDIPLLANRFLRQFRHESTCQVNGFAKSALTAICNYSWPGNVRQLRNAIHCACVVARSDTIEESDLPNLEKPKLTEKRLPEWMYESSMEEIERHVILENLARSDGNKTVVAGILGVTTRTLANKVKQYRQQGLLSPQPT